MKNLIFFFFFFFSNNVYAHEKIAFVDIDFIINGSILGKKLNKNLNKKKKKEEQFKKKKKKS